MIDFRYHLVSLVSVFLALAVGIVLGAGPLKEGIDVGITDQVRQLTTEKAELRAQLDAAEHALGVRDEWGEAVGPALVAGELSGESVVVVLLPGAEEAVADGVVPLLEAAGATVTGRVGVQDDWTDPAQADARAALAQRLRPSLPQPPVEVGSPEGVLAAVLAGGVVTDSGTGLEVVGEDAGAAVAALVEAGLVAGDVSGPATTVVLVAGPPDTALTAEQTEAQLETLSILAAQLDAASRGAVVAGPVVAGGEGALIAAIRADDDVSEAVSTVDDADVPMGRVSVALALREQIAGEAGHYGSATSAEAVTPPPAPTEPPAPVVETP